MSAIICILGPAFPPPPFKLVKSGSTCESSERITSKDDCVKAAIQLGLVKAVDTDSSDLPPHCVFTGQLELNSGGTEGGRCAAATCYGVCKKGIEINDPPPHFIWVAKSIYYSQYDL